MNKPDEDDHWKGLSWNSLDYSPDRIIIHPTYKLKFGVLWTGSHHKKKSLKLPVHTSQFPRNWENICGVYVNQFGEYSYESIVWNNTHPLVKAVTNEGWAWCNETLGTSLDPLPHRDSLLNQKDRCAAWILLSLTKNSKELWDGLIDHEPLFLQTLWQKMFSENTRSTMMPKIILVDPETSSDTKIRIASPDKWEITINPRTIASLIPDPGPEWKLTIPKKDSSGLINIFPPKTLRRKIPDLELWWKNDNLRNFMSIKRKKK